MTGFRLSLTAALAFFAGAAQADFQVSEIGSFHIGGEVRGLSGLPAEKISYTEGMAPIDVDPNGEFHVGQMYVQYVRLAEPAFPYPVLLWHGGGLTGVTWETKPDGEPGWQQFFLNAGFDTYVSDAVERGRASWARYPDFYAGPPIFRTKEQGWGLFRIGEASGWDPDPAKRKAHDGTQFPVSAYDQFTMQSVPRWVSNDALTDAAYDALVKKVCPCVVIVHSQGGNFGFRAALANPDLVKAVVAIEPSGAPKPEESDAATVAGVPHLFVFGDYMDQKPWDQLVKAGESWRDAINAAGGAAEWMALPEHGVTGNSHMLMMDKNSDEIAGMVRDWIIANVK